MRDLVYFGHIILGLLLIILPIIILRNLGKNPPWLKKLAVIVVAISWFLLLPAGSLYLDFYPATKTLVKAGAWPWAHSIIMETKEHWGILLPVFSTVAMGMMFNGKTMESKKWWILVLVLAIALAVMGRVIKVGALA